VSAPDPNDPVTSNLANQAKSGDVARFAQLYERVSPALFAWAELRIHRPMRAHVEPADLVQEVWLRAVRGLDGFDPDLGRFRSWIFQIAKHALFEAYRGMRRLPRAAHPAGSTRALFALENCPDDVSNASQLLARDDSIKHFVESARELAPDERRILLLCGLEQQTCADAARHLDLGEAAVIKRWQRLRKRLRERPWATNLLPEND